MNRRRDWLKQVGVFAASTAILGKRGMAAERQSLQMACQALKQSVDSGLVAGAVIYARVGGELVHEAYGTAEKDRPFLLGSISKPMAITAAASVYVEHGVRWQDAVHRYLPEFKGNGRDEVTLHHLLTHTSGLADQTPDNAELRKSHASLSRFVASALKMELAFAPGSQYQYSSMGILLATEIAQRLSGKRIATLVEERLVKPLGLKHSALGLGQLGDRWMPVQIEHAAPEAGGGDPTARDWDWNSAYWRALGAPWGGMQSTAEDVAKFLEAMVDGNRSDWLPQSTARDMIRNQNPTGMASRGYGFDVGNDGLTKGLSEQAYGHTGSTGTIAWHDPAQEKLCVVLTTLPGQAVKPHPRELAAEQV